MNNQEQLDQSLELPHPIDAAATATSAPSYELGQSHEQKTTASGGAAPQAASPSAQAITTAVTPAQTHDPATAATDHLKAGDADLIEKEWVAKAKEIVARTHGDPYVQNKEINKIKAQYIKKRYNKDIKQSSD